MTARLPALLTALALLLSACGGDSSDDAAPEQAAGTTTRAAGGTEGDTSSTTAGDGSGQRRTVGDIALAADQQEPVRFEGTITMVPSAGAALSEPVAIGMSGALAPADEASQVSIDMSDLARAAMAGGDSSGVPAGFAEMFDEPLETVTIGETVWMRFPLFAMFLGVEEGRWVEIPPDEASELTSGFGLGEQTSSPTAVLEQLRDAEAEVEELGTETVRGQETTHYRLLVDVAAMLEGLPDEERADAEQSLGDAEQFPLEVWVGEDGRLYRYRADLTPEMVEGQGQEVESAAIDIEFYDHGTDVTVTPPPADQVTRMEDLAGTLGQGEGQGEAGAEEQTEGS